MMPPLSAFVNMLPQQAGPGRVESMPTGLEWMVIASVVVPAVLLVVLIYLGQRNTV